MAADALGPLVAERLRSRLADIRAAETVADLVLTTNTSDDPPTVAVELAGFYRLLCRANHREIPASADGTVAWERVRRIQVIAIDEDSRP